MPFAHFAVVHKTESRGAQLGFDLLTRKGVAEAPAEMVSDLAVFSSPTKKKSTDTRCRMNEFLVAGCLVSRKEGNEDRRTLHGSLAQSLQKSNSPSSCGNVGVGRPSCDQSFVHAWARGHFIGCR